MTQKTISRFPKVFRIHNTLEINRLAVFSKDEIAK